MAVERLKRRPDFQRVAAARRRWVTPGFILQARRRRDSHEARRLPLRVGFTASRKVGNAVTRNRARRRLRALADRVLPVCGAPGYDYVLIARAETVRRSFPALVEDLTVALHRLNAPSNEPNQTRNR